MARMTKAIPENIKQRIVNIAAPFHGTAGCWDFPNSRNSRSGYGQMNTSIDGKSVIFTAHRASYEAFVGPIPAGMCICHRCDNPACFNPAHLFAGTFKDNMADMHAKGRGRDYAATAARGPAHGSITHPERLLRGIDHPKAKLTPEQVREIRSSPLGSYTLARTFGVSDGTISAIKRRLSWKHLD